MKALIFYVIPFCVVTWIVHEQVSPVAISGQKKLATCLFAVYALMMSFVSVCALELFYDPQHVNPTKNQNETSYIGAELVAINSESVYFGTIDGEIYYMDAEMPFAWDKEACYLLGMDLHDADTPLDDEIVTVWKCCD